MGISTIGTTMTKPDLTIIFLTANEHPQHWVDFQWETLKKAAGDFPIIRVTKDQSETAEKYGCSIVYDNEPQSHLNMYRQLLKACKLATTPFIATAESDTLYPRDHFLFYRPPLDAVAYDLSRWMLFTWKPELFSLRRRISNCTLIAPREYYIDALEERYGKNTPPTERIGEVGRLLHEEALGLKPRKAIEIWCKVPTIQVNHPNGTNYREAQNPTRKNLGEIKALEIPFWGKPQDLAKEYR